MKATSGPVSEGSRQTLCEQLLWRFATQEEEEQWILGGGGQSSETLQSCGGGNASEVHASSFFPLTFKQLFPQAAEKSIDMSEKATEDMLKDT